MGFVWHLTHTLCCHETKKVDFFTYLKICTRGTSPHTDSSRDSGPGASDDVVECFPLKNCTRGFTNLKICTRGSSPHKGGSRDSGAGASDDVVKCTIRPAHCVVFEIFVL